MIHYIAGTGWPRTLDKAVNHIPRIHLYEERGCPTVFMRDSPMEEGDTLIITNTAGGLNEDFHRGDIVVMSDHINMMEYTPLKGGNHVNMDDAYNADLRYEFLQSFITSKHGVYAAMRGPQFETPAECTMLRILGADMVGMSTVPEVIYARSKGVRVLGLSFISNNCFHEIVTHEKVLKATESAQELLQTALKVAYGIVTK